MQRVAQQNVGRRSPNLHFKIAGFNHTLHGSIVQIEVGNGQLQRDGFRFSRLQRTLFKAKELFDGCGYRTLHVAYIKLCHFFSSAFPRVLHPECNRDGIVLVGLFLRKGKLTIFKCSVRKAIAKGIGRIRVGKHIIASGLVGRTFLIIIALISGKMIVIDGQLSRSFGERNRQTSRGIELSKQSLCQGKAGLFAAIPLHK